MKKYWGNLLIVLAALVVMIMLLFFTDGTESVIKLFNDMRFGWIAAAFACIILFWLGDALSLHIIIRKFYEGRRIGESIRVAVTGAFFNTITPFTSGGQPAQIVMMSKSGISPGRALSITFVRSFASQTIIVLYSVVVILFKGGYFASRVPGFFTFYLLGFLLNATVLTIYFLLVYKPAIARKIITFIFNAARKIKFLKKIDKFESKLEGELKAYKECSALLKADFGMFLKLSAVQFARHTAYFSIPFLIFLAVETGVPSFPDMLAAQSMVSMLTTIIPSPGGIGGAEGAGYVFFSLFFKTAPVIAVLLIWRLITHYSALIIGGLAALLMSGKHGK